MKIVTIVCRLALLALAWVFLQALYMTWDGMRNYQGVADVAIVLGNTVMPDSSLSPWLQGRVDEALRLYTNKQVKKIFVSGGVAPGRKPEGDAMRDYLLSKGVPANDVMADNFGQNTFLTATNFLQLNQHQHFQSAVMVSSFYHVTRCKFIMRKKGFAAVYGSPSHRFFWADWYGLLRDWVGMYKYAFVY